MDTILFFYRKRGLEKPETEPVGLKRYMLIRVGLDVQKEEWFGLALGAKQKDGTQAENQARAENGTQARSGTGTENGAQAKSGTGTENGTQAKSGTRTENGTQARSKNQTESKNRTENGTETKRSNRSETSDDWSEKGETGTGGKKKGHGNTAGRAAGESEPAGGRRHRLWRLCRPVWRLRQFYMSRQTKRAGKERDRIEEISCSHTQEMQKARIRQTEEAIGRLAAQIRELAGDEGECRCVYEKGVREALTAEEKKGIPEAKASVGEPLRILPLIWKKYFDMAEFDGYRQRFWIEQVLPRAVLPHYVILGSCPEIYGLLEEQARKMKTLRWLLPEAECDEELMDFAEEFYIEYGLAIELQTFKSAQAFRKMKLACSQPANIIDFTGDICFNTAEVAEGSIWLDMLSREEKRYRINGRQGGIRYVSLKEEWKHAQRRCRAPKVLQPDSEDDADKRWRR